MKALVIGLGGAGVSIAGHLKAKLVEEGSYNSENTRFLFLDTAKDAKERLEKVYPHIPDLFQEFVDLGACVPYQVWRQNPEVKPWVSNPELLSNQALRDGAGAFRQQGRLALARDKESLRARVRDALALLLGQTPGEQTDLAIIPISSSCGGTGSSVLLDVLALVGTVYYGQVNQDPKVFPVLILPETYISRQKDHTTKLKYRGNAYAFFQELSDLSALRNYQEGPTYFAKYFSVFSADNSPRSFFNLAFCVDTLTSEGRVLEAPEPLYSTVAEGLRAFLAVGLGELTLLLVNQKTMETDEPKYRKVMATLGVRALRFPAELFTRYLQERFVYEAFDALSGPTLQAVFPDVQELRKYVDDVFRKVVGRFVFASDCSPSDSDALDHNLESNLSRKLQTSLALSDGRFRTNGKLDKQKIRNQGLVAQHVREAQESAKKLQEQLQWDLATDRERWSLPGVLRAIEKQLEAEVEETILRWGTRAAQELVAKLDVMCAERLATPQRDGDLEERIADINAQLQQKEQTIKNTVDNWPRNADFNDLETLIGHLRQWLELSAQLFILTQQKEVLNLLSLNEQGILDRWKYRLAELVRKVTDYASSARNRYLQELPKAFVETNNDATTLFLPNVAAFVAGGSWTPDNEFAVAYRKLVPGDPKDPSKALRYSHTDKGLGNAKEGFHGLFTELKAHGPKPVGGRDLLFTPAIKEGTASPFEALMEELRSAFEQFVQDLSQRNEEVRKFRENSLSERLKALPEENRQKVYNTFKNRLVFNHGHASMPFLLRIVEMDEATKQLLVKAGVVPENATEDTIPIVSRVPSRAVELILEYSTTLEELQRPGTWEQYRQAAQDPKRVEPSYLDARFEKAGGLLDAVAQALPPGEDLAKNAGPLFSKTYLLTKLAASQEGRSFITSLFDSGYFGPARPPAPFWVERDNLVLASVAVIHERDHKLRKMNEPDIQWPWSNHAAFLLFLARNSRALRYLGAWCEAVEKRLPGQSWLVEPLENASTQCQDALQTASTSDPQNAATYEALKAEVKKAKEAWEQLIRSAPASVAPTSTGPIVGL
jgi:hypothetical protein